MILVGIDIGKNQHTFSVIDKGTGEILLNPSVFDNNQNGFLLLIKKLSAYNKSGLLIGMEDTGHYHFALLKYLLDRRYSVALINPTTTDLTRKIQGGITKNDNGEYKYTVTTHTNADVPVYALGYGTECFNNTTVDNTDISKFIAKIYSSQTFGE